MTSSITLYFNCLVEKEKNFILDQDGEKAIELYLQTLSKIIISDFQYVKQSLSLTIKVDLSQVHLNMGDNVQDLNYVKIQNENQNPFYYFIISKTWKSQNTIELVLSMDTLNTFQYDGDYEISEKTLVKRMHKDRFENISGTLSSQIVGNSGTTETISFTNVEIQNAIPKEIEVKHFPPDGTTTSYEVVERDGTRYIDVDITFFTSSTYTIQVNYKLNGLLALVDLKSEEINAPTYKNEDTTIYEVVGGQNNDWALYYKSADNQEESPIECYLIPEEDLAFKYQGTESKFTIGNVPAGKYLIFSSTYPNGQLTFNYGGTLYTLDAVIGEFFNLLALYNDGLSIKTYTIHMQYTDKHGWVGLWNLVYTGDVVLENAPATTYSLEASELPYAYLHGAWIGNKLYEPEKATHTTIFTPLVDATLKGHASIDKTLSTNVKVINLPYSPTPYKVESDIYYFDGCWSYNLADEKLKLIDFNARWDNLIDSGLDSILSHYIYNTYGVINIYVDANRTLKDPKLLHSDFYRPKFVYDSFSKIFQLENIDYDNSSKDNSFKFDFVMSRNIISKFLFMFNQIKYKHSVEDYDNILAVSRNNEEVLFNSQYLNYIRTGYNYDLKAKERTETANALGIGLNLAGLMASIGLSLVPGGQALAVGGVVGSVFGLSGQLVNFAKSTAQSEENIQRNLKEKQMQGISVLNADDYDLLYAYSKNKAKYTLYKVSPQMERVLDDLFYYCGYIINEQLKPNVNTRRSFNFVQASLVVNHTNNLTNEILDDIKEKFDQGVTFLHYSFNKFDFNQDKENIELSLLEEE